MWKYYSVLLKIHRCSILVTSFLSIYKRLTLGRFHPHVHTDSLPRIYLWGDWSDWQSYNNVLRLILYKWAHPVFSCRSAEGGFLHTLLYMLLLPPAQKPLCLHARTVASEMRTKVTSPEARGPPLSWSSENSTISIVSSCSTMNLGEMVCGCGAQLPDGCVILKSGHVERPCYFETNHRAAGLPPFWSMEERKEPAMDVSLCFDCWKYSRKGTDVDVVDVVMLSHFWIHSRFCEL